MLKLMFDICFNDTVGFCSYSLSGLMFDICFNDTVGFCFNDTVGFCPSGCIGAMDEFMAPHLLKYLHKDGIKNELRARFASTHFDCWNRAQVELAHGDMYPMPSPEGNVCENGCEHPLLDNQQVT